jgi:hypothetical protein
VGAFFVSTEECSNAPDGMVDLCSSDVCVCAAIVVLATLMVFVATLGDGEHG